jgi:hypothetical protein
VHSDDRSERASASLRPMPDRGAYAQSLDVVARVMVDSMANDLTVVGGTLELVGARAVLSDDLRALIRTARERVVSLSTQVAQLQAVVRELTQNAPPIPRSEEDTA